MSEKIKNVSVIVLAILIVAMVILIKRFPDQWRIFTSKWFTNETKGLDNLDNSNLASLVLSAGDVTIPVRLGDLGQQMLDDGVIDSNKLDELYGGANTKNRLEMSRFLSDQTDLVINKLPRGQADGVFLPDKFVSNGLSSPQQATGYSAPGNKNNANIVLNYFWALGLANKNPILDQGPMTRNGDPANFASTGGWTLSKGLAMDHYSKYNLIALNTAQQQTVEEIAKNIYRPCCDNSTYFPDCNHGMAMLGFVELAVSQGRTESEIYKDALTLNSYWFANQYLSIAENLKEHGLSFQKTDPKTILGQNYSSSSGNAKITQENKVKPPLVYSNGACGV